MSYRHLMFDLDGTLIDSFPTIIEAYQRAVQAVYGYREPDESKLVRLIGLSLAEFFKAYPAADRETLQAIFAKENDALQAEGVPFFTGVREALYQAKEQGYVLSLVTSKRRAPVLHWLKTMGVEDLFTAVVTRADTTLGKPHADPILFAMEQVGATPEQVLYVGDTEHDIGCAHAAGVAAAIVAWTASNLETIVAEFSPEYVIHTPQEMLTI